MSNERKWTPEPWDYLTGSKSNLLHVEQEGTGVAILSMPKKCEANAARIVSCVNFLASHPDLSVVEVVDKKEVDRLRKNELPCCTNPETCDVTFCVIAKNQRLRATNEKLREALKHTEEWLKGWASAEPYLTRIRRILASTESASHE